jgi:hypothetical protein
MSPEYTVDAPNCWWGDPTGPYHATLNPDGLGKAVTDGVTFTPWNSILGSPVLGDVSMNGEIKPYDASLILQHNVGNITLTTEQQNVADVSGDATISAYDASLILQYSIGLITNFNELPPPIAALKSVGPGSDLFIDASDVYPTTAVFDVPVRLTSAENVKAIDLNFSSNPTHLKLLTVELEDIDANTLMANGYNSSTGEISISMASAYNLDLNQRVLNLKFEIVETDINNSLIELKKSTANENNINNSLDISVVSLISTNLNVTENDKLNIFFANQMLQIDVAAGSSLPPSTISITDLSGRTLQQFVTGDLNSGVHSFDIPAITKEGSAILLITISNKEFSITQKVLLK